MVKLIPATHDRKIHVSLCAIFKIEFKRKCVLKIWYVCMLLHFKSTHGCLDYGGYVGATVG